MLIYKEKRIRINNGSMFGPYPLYKVRSWYLFGFVLLYRRYEQLTVNKHDALSGEMT